MSVEVLKVLDPGFGATLQDRGRWGWRRFGVPTGGTMDDNAAAWANHLLENPADAPVVEFLLQGAKLTAVREVWLAITGADVEANVPTWRTVLVKAGDTIQFSKCGSGVWYYLAVEGGFAGEQFLGSASVYPRGGLGSAFGRGDILKMNLEEHRELPRGVGGRFVAADQRRDYDLPPPIRVWPGPQMLSFAEADRRLFFNSAWTITAQSDRMGYRLKGPALNASAAQIISEPVRVGSVQVPENGQPIVTMRDGPTIGGYPKLGMVDPADLSWLAQCRPGQTVRFELINET